MDQTDRPSERKFATFVEKSQDARMRRRLLGEGGPIGEVVGVRSCICVARVEFVAARRRVSHGGTAHSFQLTTVQRPRMGGDHAGTVPRYHSYMNQNLFAIGLS